MVPKADTVPPGYGYFVVTPCGHVNFMGSEAKRCLARFFPAAPDSHHLPEPLARWTASHDAGPHCWECGGRRVVAWRVDSGRKGTGCYCLHETSAALGQLSPDELEILYWIGAGKTNDEIARNVGCALGTVKKRLGNIYQLLGFENRVGAAGYAREFLPELLP